MDETRIQAYVNLIQALLSCPNGEEPQILQENSELLDLGFVQVCEAVAAGWAEEGKQNEADFLRSVASQLGEFLGMNDGEDGDNSEEENTDKYVEFIGELFQAEDESNSDIAVVYPILDRGKHLLNARFVEILQLVAANLIAEYPEGTRNIVAIIENLSIHISNFPRGNRANNIEIAIAGYQIGLNHWESGSKDWAETQNKLANAYCDRIIGDRAQNIEKAIEYYSAALTVLTRDAFPEDWAMTQNNLATAYCDRIIGDRAQNIEKAIEYYTKALTVLTRDAFPEKWAATQNNLGEAYRNRIIGDRAQNIEKAIEYYTKALTVRTRKAFPEDWAMTQNNLGLAYNNRIRGERADNLEQAIKYYTVALTVLTHDAFPEKWATTQNNLGEAYCNRIIGDKAQNIEKAIEYYTVALTVYKSDTFPEYWAGTQNNLANAYCDRIIGDRAQNIEQAIAFYTAALTIRTRETFPEYWAGTQNNLATAYSGRIRGERADNLEKAIAFYNAALSVGTRDAFPEQWAMTQNNLANAYRNRIIGERAENIDRAIRCYRQALEIRTPSAFPLDCLITGRNLGDLAFELQDWNNAIYGYEKAIEAVEQSREWAGTEAAKREIQENAIEVYFQMLQACINAQNLTKAVETAERSKARNLVELLANRDLYPKGDIPQEILTRLDSLRRDIPAIQRQLGQTSTSQLSESNNDTQKQLRDELTKLQQQLDSVLEQIKLFDPDFSLTQKVTPILHSEIQSLVADNTAIIEWYITEDKFATFVITSTSPQIQLWQSSEQDLQDLINWANEYLTDYTDEKDEYKTQWRQNLATRLQRLGEILHLDEIINLVPPTVDKLVLIPHRFLHLFPLHALNLTKTAQNNSYCLLDRFPEGVSYAPSCQLLQQAQMRQRPKFSHLFAIQNPTRDLTYANLEVQTIQQHFNPQDILIETAAKKAVIDNNRLSIADCIHFSCHGYFNFENPLLSALLLADCELPPPPPNPDPNRYLPLKNNNTLDLKQCLTLADIFDLDLRASRLVVLSACETGITDFRTLSDEYIGLPSGFLVAGSSSVLCTLWSVSDLSTAFLLIEFYDRLKPDLTVALALKEAQNWLRTVTKKDLLDWIAKKQLILNPIQELYLDKHLHNKEEQHQPFDSPFYWAAFCAIGQ
jgi:CHAT domain-containing protein/TPR repeat protein/predicted enzyme related to lactoylglutathione lyase